MMHSNIHYYTMLLKSSTCMCCGDFSVRLHVILMTILKQLNLSTGFLYYIVASFFSFYKNLGDICMRLHCAEALDQGGV